MRQFITWPRLIVLLAFMLLASGVFINGVFTNLVTAESEATTPVALNTVTSVNEVCADTHCLNWSVLAGGLGSMESDNFQMQATLGQTMAGLFSGDALTVQTGYWVITLGETEYFIYIPVILRE